MAMFNDTQTDTRVAELHHREEERLIRALAPKYGITYINLFDVPIDIEALKMITEAYARKAEIAIFSRANVELGIAVRNPKHPELPNILNDLQSKGFTPRLFLASLASISHAWERYNEANNTRAQSKGILDVNPELIASLMKEITNPLDISERIATLAEEHTATRTSQTIALIFGGALALNASDIHIEPSAQDVRIRYRLDGVLWDICTITLSVGKGMTSRLKLLSGLKLNVRKEAQDGRFTFDIGTRAVEVRSSVIPGAYGESMVMRLLDPSSANFSIEKLGLSPQLREIVEAELKRPNGAIITTGPTGSGKTSALYAFLLSIHTPQLKILTLEDPVEYKLPGIVQTQVGEHYSFAEGLRSMLRQDPDVILVGEIRDEEVAETTIHAALTGHLVLSTLHTNSAAGAIPRLVELGIKPEMIGNACNLILGQRLVRLLCPHCKKERPITTEEQKLIHRILATPVAIHSIFDAAGCDACGQSGYKGRIGVYEAIRIDAAVEKVILTDIRTRAIKEAAIPQNIPTLEQDGILKVLAGITSLDEVSRVLDLYHADE